MDRYEGTTYVEEKEWLGGGLWWYDEVWISMGEKRGCVSKDIW